MRNKKVFGRCKLPMNLQFFAEGDSGAGDSGTGRSAGGSGDAGPGEAGTDGNGSTRAAGAGDQTTGGEIGFDEYLKNPKNQAEFDRRVAKALETNRAKVQAEIEAKIASVKTEAEKLAKMNTEQKAQYEQQKKEKELADREAEITKRELSAQAKETLADKGIPIQLADVLNYSGADECQSSIEAVEKAFTEAVAKAVEDRIKGGDPIKRAPDGGRVFTREELAKMSPEEINQNWDAIQASMKSSR